MKPITTDQKETLDKATESAVRLMRFARKAEAQGLPILAQWLKDASVGCQAGVDFQKRALGDNLSTQTEQKVIDSKPNVPNPFPEFCARCGHGLHGPICSYASSVKLPSGRSCDCDYNPHNDATRSPMIEGGEKQADAIADAIQRRGLLP